PDAVSARVISVVSTSSLWSNYFLEDQHIADLQLQLALRLFRYSPAVAQRCRGCAARQATLLVAPGVKGNLVMRREELNRRAGIRHERLKHDRIRVIGSGGEVNVAVGECRIV